MPNSATAEYELAIDDLLDFTMYVFRHSPTIRRSIRLAQLGVPALMLLVALGTVLFLSRDEADYLIWQDYLLLAGILVAMVTVVGTVWAFAYPRWLEARGLKTWKALLRESKTDPVLGRTRVALTPSGIETVNENGHGVTSWRTVEQIVPTAKHIFILIGGLKGVVVPRRAFPTENEYRRFLEVAEQLRHSQGEE